MFGKGRATRACVETFVDVRSNVFEVYEGFPANDGNDSEIPMIYGHLSEGRNASSRSKRKWGDQTTETVKIICNAIEYTNGQLKAIAKRSNVQRQADDASRAEVMSQLQGIPKLSTRDRVRLLWIIMHNVHNMRAFLEVPDELKLDYCTTMLEDNA
ncbi:retrotransposon protein [Cucumis melo var. makuwa]|uniref:Retrotransposon protein n=2 Tax=Cucumis melo TaxID=3656 RepID=A0A5A7VIQ2_CUCMM|nr:retrotransposon protein [Cucumis melo var. makuwa]